MAKIQTDMSSLWDAYSGSAASGRFPCPVMVYGQETQATHIYRGYGVTRLERISGEPLRGKKGFQGTDVTPISEKFFILD